MLLSTGVTIRQKVLHMNVLGALSDLFHPHNHHISNDPSNLTIYINNLPVDLLGFLVGHLVSPPDNLHIRYIRHTNTEKLEPFYCLDMYITKCHQALSNLYIVFQAIHN